MYAWDPQKVVWSCEEETLLFTLSSSMCCQVDWNSLNGLRHRYAHI